MKQIIVTMFIVCILVVGCNHTDKIKQEILSRPQHLFIGNELPEVAQVSPPMFAIYRHVVTSEGRYYGIVLAIWDDGLCMRSNWYDPGTGIEFAKISELDAHRIMRLVIANEVLNIDNPEERAMGSGRVVYLNWKTGPRVATAEWSLSLYYVNYLDIFYDDMLLYVNEFTSLLFTVLRNMPENGWVEFNEIGRPASVRGYFIADPHQTRWLVGNI